MTRESGVNAYISWLRGKLLIPRGKEAVTNNTLGGCNVYASLDSFSYRQIAAIRNPIRQGFLTALLPSASGWDTTNTLAVDLTESGGTLDKAARAMSAWAASSSRPGRDARRPAPSGSSRPGDARHERMGRFLRPSRTRRSTASAWRLVTPGRRAP